MVKIPDNYDLFEQHDAKQQEALSKRPVCSCCGDPIQDEYFFLIQESPVCDICLNNIFRISTEDYMTFASL